LKETEINAKAERVSEPWKAFKEHKRINEPKGRKLKYKEVRHEPQGQRRRNGRGPPFSKN